MKHCNITNLTTQIVIHVIQRILPRILDEIVTPAVDKRYRDTEADLRKVEHTADDLLAQIKRTAAPLTAADLRREQAHRELLAHEAFLAKAINKMDNIDTHLTKIHSKIENIYESADTDMTPDQTETLDSLAKLRDNMHKEKVHIESSMFAHFDDTLGGIRGRSKAPKEPLGLSRNPNKSTSRQIINAVKTFLRQRVTEYYAIIPYLQYTMSSFDPKTGLYQPTPHISHEPPAAEDAVEINDSLRSRYTKQAAVFYSEVLQTIQQSEMAKILAPFKCGLNKQHTSRCYKEDGPSCIFALSSKYGRTDAQTISRLESKFKNSPRQNGPGY